MKTFRKSVLLLQEQRFQSDHDHHDGSLSLERKSQWYPIAVDRYLFDLPNPKLNKYEERIAIQSLEKCTFTAAPNSGQYVAAKPCL